MDIAQRMRRLADRFDIERDEDVASMHFAPTNSYLFWKIIIWICMTVLLLTFLSSVTTLLVVTDIYKVKPLGGNTTFLVLLTRS